MRYLFGWLAVIGSMAGAWAQTETLGSEVERAVATLRPAVVMVESDMALGQRSYGSGFIISSDGLVLTCDHVVRRAQEIACYYRNSERLRAKVVAHDEDLDLAVLQMQKENASFPTVRLGDSDLDVFEGSAVGLCGYPLPAQFFRIGVGMDCSTSTGSVSAMRLGDRDENRSRNAVLQRHLAARPGNSGGAVFRIEDSKIIGVLALSLQDNQPVAFAIPINQAKALIAQSGLSVKAAPLAADNEATIVEPGTAETLAVIRDDREMASGFVLSVSYANRADILNANMTYFVPAFGTFPSRHPRMVTDGSDFFVGGLDGFVRRFRQRRLSTDQEWSVELDYPVYMPVALGKDSLLVAAGELDSDWAYGSLDFGTRMLRGMFGGMFGGSARVQRTLNTVGRYYVLDRDDGRLKAQVDTAFPNAPVIDGDLAYCGALGQLTCFEIETGNVKWRIGDPKQALESRTWYHVQPSPDGKLYTFETPVQLAVREAQGLLTFYLEAGLGKSHDDRTSRGFCVLRCRDKETGKAEWEVPVFNPRDYLRPMATDLLLNDQGTVAFCQFGPAVAAVDLQKKKVIWPEPRALDQYLNEMNQVSWRKQQEDENLNGVSSSFWTSSYRSGVSRGLTLSNGRLYYGAYDLKTEGSDESYLAVVDANDGKEVKRLKSVGRTTPPMIHDGVVYFGAYHTGQIRSGRGEPAAWLYAYNESTLEEMWRFRVGDSGFSYPPQVVGGTLYFTTEQQLYQLPVPVN